MGSLLALVSLTGWTLLGLAHAIIIIAAVVAIVFIALRKFGITIPDWLVSMFWVIVVAFVALFALELLGNL